MHRNNRKILIFILVLIISIGFAYLSTTLNISSLIGYSGNTWDIYFDRLREETYKTNIVTAATIDNKTTVNFSISLDQPTSTYTLYADVYNGGTLDAMLDSWALTNTLDEDEAKAIDMVVTYADGTELRQNDLLKAKLHEYVKVTVIYKHTIDNDELLSSEGDLTCSLTLNYVQSDEDANERFSQNWTYIKNLNTEGTSISTTDHDGELRFIGANPNNYVTFNGNQKWRIIGVFDGKLKLIQDSVGSYSWDTSDYNLNNGWGINQWGPSTYESGETYTGGDLMKLLNPGFEDNIDKICNSSVSLRSSDDKLICGDGTDSNYTTGLVNNSLYWNASSGYCYSHGDYGKKNCDFSTLGLYDELSKEMIDDNLWYLGSFNALKNNNNNTAMDLYRAERSSYTGRQCANAYYCSDNVNRTFSWNGKVGLIYPSDYAYATGGGSLGRDECLLKPINNDSSEGNWSNTYNVCFEDNWLYIGEWYWTISPYSSTTNSRLTTAIRNIGVVSTGYARSTIRIRPVVYLKSNIILNLGNGNINTPFTLKYS